jgi:hypothetical protein
VGLRLETVTLTGNGAGFTPPKDGVMTEVVSGPLVNVRVQGPVRLDSTWANL